MPLLTIERPAWQRLKFATALGLLSMCFMVSVVFWTQRVRCQRTETAGEIQVISGRVVNSLLRCRMATRDLLAGGDPITAAMSREEAQDEFQREIDLLQLRFVHHSSLLDAALKLRDFVKGPLNSLQARYFGANAPSLIESVAYDNLHYPELKAQQDELMQELAREAGKAARAENQQRKTAELLGTAGFIAGLGILLAAFLIARGAISRMKPQSDNREAFSTLVGDIRKLAVEGQAVVEQLRASARSVEASSAQALDMLSTIGSKAERITAASGTLSKIAEQNNLLSLNAAIEAEKAGEHGLAFAVVAMEIRRLSDQTSELNGEIRQTLEDIRKPLEASSPGLDKTSFTALHEHLSTAAANFTAILAAASRSETADRDNA